MAGMPYIMSGNALAILSSPGVYFWKRGDEWLYVGASANPMHRLARHNVIGKVEPLLADDEIGFIQTSQHLELEAKMIFDHAPKYSPPKPPTGTKAGEQICMACRKVFKQRRGWQIWCSPQCRQGAY